MESEAGFSLEGAVPTPEVLSVSQVIEKVYVIQPDRFSCRIMLESDY
jgi:hypothetical protein